MSGGIEVLARFESARTHTGAVPLEQQGLFQKHKLTKNNQNFISTGKKYRNVLYVVCGAVGLYVGGSVSKASGWPATLAIQQRVVFISLINCSVDVARELLGLTERAGRFWALSPGGVTLSHISLENGRL